jgi:hypothetical protein
MPAVVIHRPGKAVHHDGLDTWTFNAGVDGRRGLVSVDVTRGSSEDEAVRAAQGLLEEAPNELQGVTSTGGGGGLSLGGGTLGGAESGAAEHDPPRVQDEDGT